MSKKEDEIKKAYRGGVLETLDTVWEVIDKLREHKGDTMQSMLRVLLMDYSKDEIISALKEIDL